MIYVKFFFIIRFFLRLLLFLFSYLLYLIQILLIFTKFRRLAKLIFIYASYFCSISLGISYDLSNSSRKNLLINGIHIANHDNPLDIFIAQYFFRMPTITTVRNHLRNILPFFETSLENFGHHSFDHLNFKDRKKAFIFLKKNCKSNNRILIFPSGSIYTSIKKRFSKSISMISKTNNIKVVTWQINYEETSKRKISYKNNAIQYLISRFSSDIVKLKINNVKIFDPINFDDYKELHKSLKDFYN